MLMFTLAISCDHFQFSLIHGPNIPGSYAILLFIALNLSSITSPIHNWVVFLLWLHPFLLSGVISPLISSSTLGTYDLGSSSFSVLSFCLFILFMGFSRQEYWSGFPFPCPVDHMLSELFTMTRPSWGPYTAWLIVSLSYTRLLSMWSDWLVFCDCGFHSVYPLTDKDKRFMEASWWERQELQAAEGDQGAVTAALAHGSSSQFTQTQIQICWDMAPQGRNQPSQGTALLFFFLI